MTYDERLLEFGAIRELLAGRCVSDLGRRRVAELMPSTDQPTLEQAIALVREMMKLLAERKEPPIHNLRDVTGHLRKVSRERSILEPSELLEIRDFCDTAGRMRTFFEQARFDVPGLNALAMPLYNVPGLVRSIDEKIAPNSTVRDNASELLQRLRSEIFQSEQQIQRQLQRMVRELTDSGDLMDDFFTLRNDRYVLPVKSSNRGKVRGIIHDSSNTGETVFIEPFVILEESNHLADLRLSEREEIYRILLRMATHVRDELNVLLTDLEILSEFDLVYAKARFGLVHSCSFPSITPYDRPIRLASAHHPLLYARDPVGSRPLDVALDTNDRVLVITGPNAGGKTTALKTIGLTVLMVQCAIPVPLSSRSHMPLFTHVLADIGDEQNVLEGYSTFSAHMRRIVKILKRADSLSLVLLDELGTATDPGEGSALAVAILETLAERGCLSVVSTHLSALKNWAFDYRYGRNASFRLSESDHRPTFHLSLDVPGISEALVIAEQVGLPAEIIARARSLRPDSERDVTGLLLSLQEKEQKLVDQLAENEKLHVELEAQKSDVDTLEALLREERRSYKTRMLEEKEHAVRELRARVESLIAHQPSKQELSQMRRVLEEETAGVAQEREELKGQPDHLEMLDLKAGDRVYVKNLNEEGIVQEANPRRGQVRVFVRSMLATVKLSDLAPLAKVKRQPVAEEPEAGVNYKRPAGVPVSIDLHGWRAAEAIDEVEKFIDNALAAGMGYVRIVHGQGSGKLRRAIHDHLRGHPLISGYRYGTPSEGGGSVTIVEFK